MRINSVVGYGFRLLRVVFLMALAFGGIWKGRLGKGVLFQIFLIVLVFDGFCKS